MVKGNKKRMENEIVCHNCKKELVNKIFKESNQALARYTAKLRKELKNAKSK